MGKCKLDKRTRKFHDAVAELDDCLDWYINDHLYGLNDPEAVIQALTQQLGYRIGKAATGKADVEGRSTRAAREIETQANRMWSARLLKLR